MCEHSFADDGEAIARLRLIAADAAGRNEESVLVAQAAKSTSRVPQRSSPVTGSTAISASGLYGWNAPSGSSALGVSARRAEPSRTLSHARLEPTILLAVRFRNR
jgi:hypothetical protein